MINGLINNQTSNKDVNKDTTKDLSKDPNNQPYQNNTEGEMDEEILSGLKKKFLNPGVVEMRTLGRGLSPSGYKISKTSS